MHWSNARAPASRCGCCWMRSVRRQRQRASSRRCVAAGGEVAWFHPMRLRRIWKRPWLNLRSHRKIVVIDGRIAFTGGINITDEENDRLRDDAYRDLHLRLEGDVVRPLQLVFVEDWAYATGTRDFISSVAKAMPAPRARHGAGAGAGVGSGLAMGSDPSAARRRDPRSAPAGVAGDAVLRAQRPGADGADVGGAVGTGRAAAGAADERQPAGDVSPRVRISTN